MPDTVHLLWVIPLLSLALAMVCGFIDRDDL